MKTQRTALFLLAGFLAAQGGPAWARDFQFNLGFIQGAGAKFGSFKANPSGFFGALNTPLGSKGSGKYGALGVELSYLTGLDYRDVTFASEPPAGWEMSSDRMVRVSHSTFDAAKGVTQEVIEKIKGSDLFEFYDAGRFNYTTPRWKRLAVQAGAGLGFFRYDPSYTSEVERTTNLYEHYLSPTANRIIPVKIDSKTETVASNEPKGVPLRKWQPAVHAGLDLMLVRSFGGWFSDESGQLGVNLSVRLTKYFLNDPRFQGRNTAVLFGLSIGKNN
ncbi:MAG: hypothetical protein HY401_02315 [Elusimicrobia bacterium]|nr:hypothetical protein [Elusimicrobiota bacterium]